MAHPQRWYCYNEKGRFILYLPPALRGTLRGLGMYTTVRIRCNSTAHMRSEPIVFSDLARLCASDGYIHALAFVCANNEIVLGSKPFAENEASTEPWPELTNIEIMTLVGLLIKGPINYDLPSPEDLAQYVGQTYALLEELHVAIVNAVEPDPPAAPPSTPSALREPILYSGDSAYHFQYSHFATLKYRADADWLLRNENIDLDIGRAICEALRHLHEKRMDEAVLACQNSPPEKRSLLSAFQFSLEDLSFADATSTAHANDFIQAFSLPHGQTNADFTSITAHSVANACPIIRRSANEFIVLSHYCLTQAFYVTPYYWLLEDKEYRNIAADNRGNAAESISADLLARVFSVDRVFKNVKIVGSKGDTLGEIDVLIAYGNRVIILQAKSKRLTVEARTGNAYKIQDDFEKAVCDAADQAYSCAQLIGKPGVCLRSKDGRPIPPIGKASYSVPITVLLDHYPALLFQTRLLLTKQSTERIASPFVTDVFALDTMAEMLDSPIRFLHYLTQRERDPDRLWASQEHELLSLYLQRGLAFKEDVSLVYAMGDLAGPIDVAMCVRRDGAEGPETPEGVIDQLANTHFGNMVSALDQREDPTAINLALVLLDMAQSSTPIQDTNKKVEKCLSLVMGGDDHRFCSVMLPHLSTGITIMCVSILGEHSADKLWSVCNSRKYGNKLPSWFGILLGPSGECAYACELSWPWKHDPNLAN